MHGIIDLHAAGADDGKVAGNRCEPFRHCRARRKGRCRRRDVEKERAGLLDGGDLDQARDCRQGGRGTVGRVHAALLGAAEGRRAVGAECGAADGLLCGPSHAAAAGGIHEGFDRPGPSRGRRSEDGAKGRSWTVHAHGRRRASVAQGLPEHLRNVLGESARQPRYRCVHARAGEGLVGCGRHPAASAPDHHQHVPSPSLVPGARHRHLRGPAREDDAQEEGPEDGNGTGSPLGLDEERRSRGAGPEQDRAGRNELAEVQRLHAARPRQSGVAADGGSHRGRALASGSR
mmetsp:Transcript_4364/g.12536  ORF Transcript_4364/g.12536 Transcript_4364/m.12536 type:complete len:289 (+) Transcript_4364:98-964(+)